MIRAFVRHLIAIASSVLLGLAVIALVAFAWFLSSGPDLQSWHEVQLKSEFKAGRTAGITSLDQYRHLEDRLFDELNTRIVAGVDGDKRSLFNRYSSGSRSDPAIWQTNWNRTFEIRPAHPTGAVLLLHGLTDSPYSLRAIGEHLAASGLHVVGLRLPGHGTAPSGLLSFEIEDMQAIVRMAMQDLRAQQGGDRPIYMVGYSNGAALAVDYSVAVIEGVPLPKPAGLILISPAIGISPLAIVGRLRTGISALPGFGRAAWQTIELEIDPYKYSSFSFHAAGETQRLTRTVARRVAKLSRRTPIESFPPVLAFLSTVDATVRAEAVVDALMAHLAPAGHELVLFDINRLAAVRSLLIADPGPLTGRLLAMPERSFTLSVITNASPESWQVVELRAEPGSETQRSRALGLSWPRNVFSLSHLALPVPPDDPLYGFEAAETGRHVQFGRVEARGEIGVLAVPSWLLVRQRSNPFFGYMIERIDGFIANQTAP
jgi:alpha-beta hydrolase superfamily lysophospholipase